MHVLLLAATLSLATLQAARAADEGVNLVSATCTAMKAEGAVVNPRNLAPAYAGRVAARAGNAVLSPELVKAIGETIRRGCEGPDTADRKLADIISGIAMPAKGDKDRDFAALTCAQLAPIWREEARQIVPFLVSLRDVGANAALTKAGLDKVGEGLPKLCREPGNEAKLVTEMAKTLQ